MAEAYGRAVAQAPDFSQGARQDGQEGLDSGSGCPIRGVLDRIGDQWSFLVLFSLENGPVRFNMLKRQIGDVSQHMLARTLKRLEQDGLVTRTQYPVIPPRVDYDLTALGRSFLEPMRSLVRWADTHQRDVEAARRAYVTRNKSA